MIDDCNWGESITNKEGKHNLRGSQLKRNILQAIKTVKISYQCILLKLKILLFEERQISGIHFIGIYYTQALTHTDVYLNNSSRFLWKGHKKLCNISKALQHHNKSSALLNCSTYLSGKPQNKHLNNHISWIIFDVGL